jgi:hypothetical protein
MSVVFLSTDLVFASRVEGTAKELGTPVKIVGDAAAAAAACDDAAVRLVIIDLESAGPEVAQAVALVVDAARKQTREKPLVLAYGPHVHEARLDAARAAGCDRVLSRGQFSSQMREILAGTLN